jgi:hypothetical protein
VHRAVLPGHRNGLLAAFVEGRHQAVAPRAPEARTRRGGAIERFEDGA